MHPMSPAKHRAVRPSGALSGPREVGTVVAGVGLLGVSFWSFATDHVSTGIAAGIAGTIITAGAVMADSLGSAYNTG